MFTIDFDRIAKENEEAGRRDRAAFERIVAKLRTDTPTLKALEASTGETIDVATPGGIEAFARLLNRLGDRKEAAINFEVEKLQEREEAKRRFLASKAEEREALPLTALGTLLETEIAEEEYVIGGLLHSGGNVMFTAARKSGKSTVIGNLIRSLVDGDDFLDVFPATTRRKVALIDLELSPATLQKWLREQGIRNVDAVTVVSLRGRARAFNILDDATRSELADQLRGHDTIILDPLRPLADALGLNEHTEMGRLLEAFDALKAEAGISEGVIVHHHGHGSDRARGDSRLEDWPDALWRLHRTNLDDPHAIRTFTAFGRDVALDAGAVRLDGRRLTFVGDVGEVKNASLTDAVVTFLATRGESKTSEIVEGVAGVTKNNSASVLQAAVNVGAITHRKDGTSHLYSVTNRPF